MKRIREYFENLFSMSNLSSGLLGLGFGGILSIIVHFLWSDPFRYFSIFIMSIGFFVSLFILGQIINNLFKDDD